MTKSKNSGSTGRKRKGHAINSVEQASSNDQSDTSQKELDFTCYLIELVLKDFHVNLDKILDKKQLSNRI